MSMCCILCGACATAAAASLVYVLCLCFSVFEVLSNTCYWNLAIAIRCDVGGSAVMPIGAEFCRLILSDCTGSRTRRRVPIRKCWAVHHKT